MRTGFAVWESLVTSSWSLLVVGLMVLAVAWTSCAQQSDASRPAVHVGPERSAVNVPGLWPGDSPNPYVGSSKEGCEWNRPGKDTIDGMAVPSLLPTLKQHSALLGECCPEVVPGEAVRLSFWVTCKGEVKGAWVMTDKYRNTSVGQCLMSRIAQVRFPEFHGKDAYVHAVSVPCGPTEAR